MLLFTTLEKILAVEFSLLMCYSCYRDGYSSGPGEPLFLTPYILQERVSEARIASEVRGDLFGTSNGYSGFLTVNQEYNSNLFFLYVPSRQNLDKAPVVIWMQGGPGVSSFNALFDENGPIWLTDDKVVKRTQYSWVDYCSFIYFDAPIGTGFSFTDNDAGYSNSVEQIGRDLYEAVRQLYVIFPELSAKPLYLGGTSLGAKFAASLGYRIHQQQQMSKNSQQPNLHGLIFSGAVHSPSRQYRYAEQLYNWGLLDGRGLKVFRDAENKIHESIDRNDSLCAYSAMNNLMAGTTGSCVGTLFYNLTGFVSNLNLEAWNYELAFANVAEVVQTPAFRKLVHVGNKTFHLSMPRGPVGVHLSFDFARSVAPWVAELLDGYNVCFFHGQMDIVSPYNNLIQYLESLNFNGLSSFKNARRKPWKVDGQLAGYVKQSPNLIVAMLRNSGHIACRDHPKWVYETIKKFINGEQF